MNDRKGETLQCKPHFMPKPSAQPAHLSRWTWLPLPTPAGEKNTTLDDCHFPGIASDQQTRMSPKTLSQISKRSLDSAPAEKMQGVLLLAGTSPHRSADSRRPLKSFGPVSVSAKKNPPCQFPPFPQYFKKMRPGGKLKRACPQPHRL